MQKGSKKRKKGKYGIWLFLLCCTLLLGKKQVYAESGNVYTCGITASYAHPVTGNIEDAGGESSSATGQGMVEGAIGAQGILEVTDTGSYYLTVRFSLMDYASSHEISVQNVGDSGWQSTSVTATATGSDSSGSTEDDCIEVPSQSCIVRCSMYVEPMGRNVIFYFYPDNYQTGNQTDMKAMKVTEASMAAKETQISDAAEKSSEAVSEKKEESKESETEERVRWAAEDETEHAAETEAGGLSLSTAAREQSAGTEKEETADESPMTLTDWIVALTVSMTLSGLILLTAGTGIFLLLQRHPQWWKGDWEDD